MQLISTVTVGAGGAASIDFTSIPAAYTDLCVVFSGRFNLDNYPVGIYFNNDTTDANYSKRRLVGNGSAASSDSASGPYLTVVPGASSTANTFGNQMIWIPNYAGSSNKSFSADGVSETNATTAYQGIIAGLWNNTAAINAIKLRNGANTIQQYSTASLYGILKGSGGATVA